MLNHPYQQQQQQLYSQRPRTNNSSSHQPRLSNHSTRGMTSNGPQAHLMSHLKTQNKQHKNIDDLMQALSNKLSNNQSKSTMREKNELSNDNILSTSRTQAEKQIGIILSKLSKKFPLSDVLEKEALQEKDEELAMQIQARMFPNSKSALMMQRYFSGEQIPPFEPQIEEGENVMVSRNMMIGESKSPILPNNASNPKIFGKLKYREQKIPSTALEQSRQYKSFIKEKRKPQPMQPFPFLSPQKLEFFKSHYPRSKINVSSGEDMDGQFLSQQIMKRDTTFSNEQQQQTATNGFDMRQYTGAPGMAYYQPSFIGLENKNSQHTNGGGNYSLTDDRNLNINGGNTSIYKSKSVLRDNFPINTSYMKQMANQNRDNNCSSMLKSSPDGMRAADYIFKDDYEEFKNKNIDDELLNYDEGVNIQVQNTSKQFLGVPLSSHHQQNYQFQNQVRAKTQVNGRRKSQKQRRTIYNQDNSAISQQHGKSQTPSLAELVKLPKRLQVKQAGEMMPDRSTSAATYTLYNCCPQAAFIDRQMEERMTGATLRQNLLNMQQRSQSIAPTTILMQKKSSNDLSRSPVTNKSIDKNQQSLTKRFEKRRTMNKILSNLNHNNLQGIEQHKLHEARDYIYKILGYRVESQYNPFNYEYIDINKPSHSSQVENNSVSSKINKGLYSIQTQPMIIDDIY